MPEHTNNTPHKPDWQSLQVVNALQTRTKLALSFAILLIVITTAFWLLFQNELNRSLREYSDILGTSLAEQTAASVRELVLVNDPLGLNVVLTQLVSDNNIVYASVFDVDGTQLASAGQRSFSSTGLPSNTAIALDQPGIYRADISVQDAIAGMVQLELDASTVVNFQSHMRILFILVLAISLILVVTTAFALAGSITSPLLALAELISDKIANNAPAERITTGNETAQLQYLVDTLLKQVEEMEGQLLETGVWPSSAEQNGNVPARLAATIMVIKVVNINTAIELLHPPTLAKLLREYLSYLNQAARLYGGTFQHRSGDSVLLSFDSINCRDQHSINALHCAGLFQAIMNKINTRHRNKGEQILEFRMAIHSGDIFHAPELFNSEREEGSVLGKTIDIAYFLCKQSAPNQLLISDSAFSQARNFSEIETSGQHEVSMPADNVSFIAYILQNNFASTNALIRKQCEHIISMDKKTDSFQEREE